MNARAFCHRCGADIALDEPITIGNFEMQGDYPSLTYRGVTIRLTSAEAAVFWSLMKAFPNQVSCSTLLNRIGSDGTTATVKIHISRIRQKMRDAGTPVTIETVWGRGYRWIQP